MTYNKQALCVGIDKFKNFRRHFSQGCVNDAIEMSLLLKEFFGFEDTNITILTDAKATKANILKKLKRMVADAKVGKLNYLFFSMSCCGSLFPTASDIDPNRAADAFCPYDLKELNNKWDIDHIIIDEELYNLFVQFPRNVLIEVLIDSCYSGTGAKSVDLLLDRKPRYLPIPSLEAFYKDLLKFGGRTLRGLSRSLLDKGLANHILWLGCRADEVSFDTYINRTWHGAFTYYLCQEVRKSKNRLSRQEVLKKVREDLKAKDYKQTPQLQGKAIFRNSPIG